MKKKVLIHTLYFAVIGLVFGGVIAIASNVGTLNTFVSGETAVAADVNANFQALKDAINNCPSDMVKAGSVCVDIYEASVWDSYTMDGTGTQYGASSDDYLCNDNGNDCSSSAANPIYARSIADVTPARYITWFQAQQACANSGKRLITNAEWQMAAAGTPDPGTYTDNTTTDCAVSSSLSGTGSRSSCVSNWGTYDMVGNVWEWTADWMQDNTGTDGVDVSPATYGEDDITGIDNAYPEADGMPAALVRGGHWRDGPRAGVFALDAYVGPSFSRSDIGFRCTR